MILVTGIAGFIGMHTARALLTAGEAVIGLDSLNDYYDPALKQARLAALTAEFPKLVFLQVDLAQPHALATAMAPYAEQLTHIVHLAAQAGVRYSIEAPRSYISANIAGTLEVLELCRSATQKTHLVYASSSSVYGNSADTPFTPAQRTDHPVSLYAATKKSVEVITDSYATLYDIKATGLRFFTVYGPWGRPDMAYFSFTKRILEGAPIAVFNHGDMRRDFTYIDDIVAGIMGAMGRAGADHRIYNLGNHRSEKLMDMICYLETHLGHKAVLDMQPMQPGDVHDTFADISDSARDFGYAPKTLLADGLKSFVSWYRSHYG
ncbi:MAG: SDR family NAD(P)-dependent oxidoreductase [Rickettsiales bacterium]